jgi:hypothetical protein
MMSKIVKHAKVDISEISADERDMMGEDMVQDFVNVKYMVRHICSVD